MAVRSNRSTPSNSDESLADAQAEQLIEGRTVQSFEISSLDDEDRERLSRVLKELLDCKRILERAREG